MRGCYYTSRRRSPLLKVLYILPNLALPIGLQPHTSVPVADNNGQRAVSNIQAKGKPVSKPYNANQTRSESLRSTTSPCTSGPPAINECSQPFGHLDSQEKSNVDDDWISDGILRYYESTEEDFPYLIHLCRDQPAGSNLDLADAQEYEALLATSELPENAEGISPFLTTGERPESVQELQNPQASQYAHGSKHPEEHVQSTQSSACETTRPSKTPVTVSVDLKDVGAEISSTPGSSVYDQARQQPAEVDFSAPRPSNPSLVDSQERVHPRAQQPWALRQGAYTSRAERNTLPSAVSSSCNEIFPEHRAKSRKRKASPDYNEPQLEGTKRTVSDPSKIPRDHIDISSSSVTQEAVVHNAGKDSFHTNSSLLLLRALAQALESSKLKSIERLVSVLEQSTQAHFVTRMHHLAVLGHASRARLKAVIGSECEERWRPVIHRVGQWLRRIAIQRSEGMCPDHVTQPANKERSKGNYRNVRVLAGGRLRSVHVDMTSGFLFHHLLEKREIVKSFINTIFASSTQDGDLVHKAWKSFNGMLSTKWGIEKDVAQTDLEAILCYALLFTIVSENIDVKAGQLCPQMLGSEEFAEAIVFHAKEFLSGRRGLKMSVDQLNNLQKKCKWIIVLPSDSDEPLVRDEEKLKRNCKSQFYLERIARCFKSISTLSTTITKRGWAAEKIREIILSRTLVRKEELQAELKTILALSGAIDMRDYGDRSHLKAWEKDILVILKRSQAWMEVLTAEGAANMTLWFRKAHRNKVRDFVDVLGFFLHTLNIMDGAALEPLRSKTVELLLACRGSQIRVNDESTGFDALVQAFNASRIAQELLLCSTLHYLLAENISLDGGDYFDYSVLTEEDVTAICNQAKKYLAIVRSPTIDSSESDIELPECERSRIIKRLRG